MGKDISFRNFEGTDDSTDEVVSMVLWEDEWVKRAAFWEPKQTALFLTDARIVYDNFKKKIVLSIGRSFKNYLVTRVYN